MRSQCPGLTTSGQTTWRGRFSGVLRMGRAAGQPSLLAVFHDYNGMVAAMMTAMMNNNYHLAHERFQNHRTGRGKKYCERN